MIYLDNAATTKPLDSAIEYASKFNKEQFFNPSALYRGGLSNLKEINTAKETLLKALGSVNHDVIFTSCGSESDNQALFRCYKRGTIITSLGEHSAIYNSVLELKNRGFNTVFAPFNNDGSVKVDELLNLVKNNDTTFVSIVHVNNETGASNDINYIADKIKEINTFIKSN